MRFLKYTLRSLVVISIMLIGRGCKSNPQAVSDALVWLRNDSVTLGILVDVGGRVVYYGRDTSYNYLKSDRSLWHEDDSLRPEVSAQSGWKAYNGHTVWLGPQSEWWMHQDLNMEKRARLSQWPPDPWLIYAPYTVIEHRPDKLIIESPESPVSGVKLKKEFYLIGNSSVEIRVTATNVRDTAVSWDLWMNTRVRGDRKIYVPVKDLNKIRINSSRNQIKDTIPYEIQDGYFSYLPADFHEPRIEAHSKAFITPNRNVMAMYENGHLFLIEFPHYDPVNTHPAQGMIEIYNSQSIKGESLTEMEFHGPYGTILPKESVTTYEIWRLIAVSGSHAAITKTLDHYALPF